MPTLLSILGVCAALMMCAASGAMNYLFMVSLGKTPLEGQVLGAASAAADVLKALLPFFIAWSWAAKRMVAAVSGTLAFLFFAGFSLLSAIGFAADNRGVLVDTREGISAEYNRMQGQIGEAEARRAVLPVHRPAAVVTEEIGAHRQNGRWQATKDCTNATEPESRAFCAEYFRLRAELAAAQEAERLSEYIDTVQAESACRRTAPPLKETPNASRPSPSAMASAKPACCQPRWMHMKYQTLTLSEAMVIQINYDSSDSEKADMDENGKLTDFEKIAVDAAIKRQQSLLDLMRHTDNRSQQLTIAYAGFMGAGLLFVARDANAAMQFSTMAIVAMLVYAVALSVGATFGFFAAWYAKVGLASRGGDYWLWALDPQNMSRAIPEFLRNAEEQLIQNETIQTRAAKLLRGAMACGLIAVFAASLGFVLLVARGLCS